MKYLVLLAALATATPALAQDATPEGQLVEGMLACILGGGDVAATEAILAPFGWTTDAESEADMGLVSFLPAVGEATWVYMGTDGSFCQAESTVIGTEKAFQVALASLEGAELAVTANEKDDLGCDGARLANGVLLSLTSGGNDPTCASDTDSALRAIFAPAP